MKTDLCPLTPRQRAVLELVCEGMPDKAIADHLGISVRTVEVHKRDIRRRSGGATIIEIAIADRLAFYGISPRGAEVESVKQSRNAKRNEVRRTGMAPRLSGGTLP